MSLDGKVMTPDVQVLLAFATSVGVCVAVGGLFGFHLALSKRFKIALKMNYFNLCVTFPFSSHRYLLIVRSGQTTIEYYESWVVRDRLQRDGRIHKNQYDRGLNKNVQAVFGNLPWYRAILPSLQPPPGVSYPAYSHKLDDI